MDRFDGGTVRLPDGEWRCSVVRLYEMPQQVVVSQLLFFEHRTASRTRMRVVVPEECVAFEPEALVRYAMSAGECWWRGKVGCGKRPRRQGKVRRKRRGVVARVGGRGERKVG